MGSRNGLVNLEHVPVFIRKKVEMRVEVGVRCARSVFAFPVVEDREVASRFVQRRPSVAVSVRIKNLGIPELLPGHSYGIGERAFGMSVGYSVGSLKHDNSLGIECRIFGMSRKRMSDADGKVNGAVAVVADVRDTKAVGAVFFQELKSVQVQVYVSSRDNIDSIVSSVKIECP